MTEELVYKQINRMLKNLKSPLGFKSTQDVEDFLSVESNMRLEVYEDIEQLYSQLMDDTNL